MHILIIPSVPPYVPIEYLLPSIFPMDQAIVLKKAGYKIGILSPNLRSLALIKNMSPEWKHGFEFENDNGIPVYRFHGWNWFPLIINSASQRWVKIGMRLFERYVDEQGMPDIVHAHNAFRAGMLANQIKNMFAIPYVITEHSSHFARRLFNKVSLLQIKSAYKNSEVIIVVSPSLKILLESLFDDVIKPFELVPNILNHIFENEALRSKKYKSKSNVFRFLNVAVLEEIKGHSDLLKAFAKKFKGLSDVQLRIGGHGSLQDKLVTLAKKLKVEKQVLFLGYLSREQVLHEMKKCDIFVLSSYYETFGVVLIEALSCGKPVIATDCGGPRSIITRSNGILVPAKDIDSLGNAMAEIHDTINTYDSESIISDCIARYGQNAFVTKLSKIYFRIGRL